MKRAKFFQVFSSVATAFVFLASSGETLGEARRFNFDSHIGVVLLTSDDGICMQIKNPNLEEGRHLKLVSLGRPQSVLEASVLKKLSRMCQASGFQDGLDYYSLRLSNRQVEQPEIALAVVNPVRELSVKKGSVSVDLDKDGRREYFRKCTSSEGVHLTIWSRQPLKGKRRWHYYYYLRYDVVPTCHKKDYIVRA